MDAYFNNNQIETIHFWPETNTTITPLYLAKRNSYFLSKFIWLEDLRPFAWYDVFNVPEGMEQLLKDAPPVMPGPDGPGGPKKDTARPNSNAPADRTMPDGPDPLKRKTFDEPLPPEGMLPPDGLQLPDGIQPSASDGPSLLSPSGNGELPGGENLRKIRPRANSHGN